MPHLRGATNPTVCLIGHMTHIQYMNIFKYKKKPVHILMTGDIFWLLMVNISLYSIGVLY